jgi:hypothetical protein
MFATGESCPCAAPPSSALLVNGSSRNPGAWPLIDKGDPGSIVTLVFRAPQARY